MTAQTPPDNSTASWLGIPAPIWVIFVNAITLIILSERNHSATVENGEKATAAAAEAKVAATEAKTAIHENTVIAKATAAEQKKIPDIVARVAASASKSDMWGDAADPPEGDGPVDSEVPEKEQ